MAYRLKSSENLEDSFHRIAAEQFNKLKQRVAGADAPGPTAIHEARKGIKRLRALLRLFEPALEAKQFRKHNRELRDISRLMSGSREAVVILTTLDLVDQQEIARTHKAVSKFRQLLSADGDAVGHQLSQDVVADIGRRIAQESAAVSQWCLQKNADRAIQVGLESAYRRARREMTIAYDVSSAEALHEFRKTVQWHWRHMALVHEVWPEEAFVRLQAARQLSQDLGADHDLDMLAHRVSECAGLSKADKVVIETLCRKQQETLRAATRWQAERLFAEKPSAFSARFAAYWRLSQR